ncbi:MAG: DNA repair protein RadC [Thermoplasmata archaeon]|nr:DNA repair protein RadC [Thermoplasmata archaeon]MBE3139602.1 DNA repair protein RadC [Thermoplasmata archaeon]
MNIREMPWFERPGARLKRGGPEVLSDAELLAIVLGRGSKEENVIDCSRRVLREQNLNYLAEQSLPELAKTFGDDTVKALKVSAMFELFRRTNRLKVQGFSTKIQSAEDVYHYFADRLAEKKKEYFYALCLDTKNRIISETLVSVGILDASLIHPREVFNPAVKASCHAVILVHNHPSGEAEASAADIEVTKMLYNAGDIIGISILDHIIIGKQGYVSMKEKGGLLGVD